MKKVYKTFSRFLLCMGIMVGVAAPLNAQDSGIVPPFTSNFAETGSNGYIVIDNDKDARSGDHTWMYDSSKNAWIVDDWNSGKDDWLITPAFYLEVGKSYDFNVILQTGSNTNEHLEILYGNAPEIDAMTGTVIAEFSYASRDEVYPVSGNFTVDATGTYYIAFHAKTKVGVDQVIIKEYSIIPQILDIPEDPVYPAPTNLTGMQYDTHFQLNWDEPDYTLSKTVTEEHLLGYKVYRDDVLKTEQHIEAREHQDTEVVSIETNSYKYGVTAVYQLDDEQFESDPVEMTFNVTSVEMISGIVSVDVHDGFIIVRNADGLDINVVAASGMTVYKDRGEMVNAIRVNSGIYIVTVDNKTYKVIVK